MKNTINPQRLRQWLHLAGEKHRSTSENLALRRDVVAVLTYVRDHKVVGTQSTGNFPLKVVREVTAQFVNPPVLDTTIGDRVYRLRSEDDVWPLVFVHALAFNGGLLALEPNRRWQLTDFGHHFLTSRPEHQIWELLAVWWTLVDWTMAYPVTGLSDGLPPRFRQITQRRLLSLPVETRISFEAFADELIRETGFKWPSRDPSFHRLILHGAVRNIVMNPMSRFGIVTLEHQDKPLGKGVSKELVAFQVTPFGRDLLESLPL